MALINVSNLTFSYEGSFDNVFENTSFQIDTDWKLGFIGRNGRGKTTFIQLLQGKYEYKGKISSSVNFEYFPYEVFDKNRLTIDIMEEIYPEYELWQVIREFNLLEVSADVLYRPFDTLSLGEKTKVLLAVLFLKENSFLLIDEPTNHLDIKGRRIVSDYLNLKKGFILVSHDRIFLDNCVDYVLSINRSSIELQKGNFSSWWENKRLQDEFEIRKNSKIKREIGRLETSILEKRTWSDTAESRKIGFDPKVTEKNIGRRPYQAAKAKKSMKRAKAIQERLETAVEEKSKLLKNIENIEELKLFPIKYHSEKLIEIDKVSIFYGEKEIFENLSFSIFQGDKISLQGKNGSGKSSILKLICGFEIDYSGEVRIGSQLKISYVPQDSSFLKGSLKEYAEKLKIDESLFKSILRKLDFKREQFEMPMETFSQGQKKKTLIAASLCEKAHIYIWDEPLNYIDVFSRIQIEDLIIEYNPTLLLVEHDLEFVKKVCSKIVNIN